MGHLTIDRSAGAGFSRRGRRNSIFLRCSAVLIRALATLAVSCPLVYAQVENEPVLRLEADGPTSYVTSVAFSPNGRTLYAGSWDKAVYVWKWDETARE